MLIQVYASISTISAALNLSLVNRHLHDLWKKLAPRLVEPISLRDLTDSKQALQLVSIQEVVRQPGTVYGVDCSEHTFTKPQAYKKIRQLTVNAKDAERADQLFRDPKNSHPDSRRASSYRDGLSGADFYTLQLFTIAQGQPNIVSQLEQELINLYSLSFDRLLWIMKFFLDPHFDLDGVFEPSSDDVQLPQTRFTPFVTLRKVDWLCAYVTISNFRICQLQSSPPTP